MKTRSRSLEVEAEAAEAENPAAEIGLVDEGYGEAPNKVPDVEGLKMKKLTKYVWEQHRVRYSFICTNCGKVIRKCGRMEGHLRRCNSLGLIVEKLLY